MVYCDGGYFDPYTRNCTATPQTKIPYRSASPDNQCRDVMWWARTVLPFHIATVIAYMHVGTLYTFGHGRSAALWSKFDISHLPTVKQYTPVVMIQPNLDLIDTASKGLRCTTTRQICCSDVADCASSLFNFAGAMQGATPHVTVFPILTSTHSFQPRGAGGYRRLHLGPGVFMPSATETRAAPSWPKGRSMGASLVREDYVGKAGMHFCMS
jgi:hypothetical protein